MSSYVYSLHAFILMMQTMVTLTSTVLILAIRVTLAPLLFKYSLVFTQREIVMPLTSLPFAPSLTPSIEALIYLLKITFTLGSQHMPLM